MNKLVFKEGENKNNFTVPIRVSNCNYTRIKEISNRTDYTMCEVANMLISHSLKYVEFEELKYSDV